MPSTPRYELAYPEAVDAVDPPADLQALATSTEAALTGQAAGYNLRNLGKLRAALTRARNGGAPVRQANYGDSIVQGFQATGGMFINTSFSGLLRDLLDDSFPSKGTGLIPCNIDPGGPIVLTGAWGQFSEGLFGQNAARYSADPTMLAELTWTCDGFSVYFLKRAGGTFDVLVDGVLADTVDMTTGDFVTGDYCRVDFPAGTLGTLASHTVTVKGSTGGETLYLLGLEATASTDEWVVNKLGHGGLKTVDTVSHPDFTFAQVRPDFATLYITDNDFNEQVALATVKTNLEAWVTAARAAGAAAAFIIPAVYNDTLTIPQSSYVAKLYEVADEQDVAVLVDLQLQWGTFAEADAAGLMSTIDGIHPSPAGHAAIASLLHRATRHALSV